MKHETDLNAMTCFKAYDIRGRIGDDLNEDIVRRIGLAFAAVMQPRTVVIGRDCRSSSPALADALSIGLQDAGVHVLDIGLAGTEEVYFATTHFGADGGIEVTASHNPINYNGLKLVGPGSRPLTDSEFKRIAQATSADAIEVAQQTGGTSYLAAREAYANHIVDLIDVNRLKPIKVVVNAGNGVAGAAFDAVAAKLERAGAQIDFVRINHAPDGSFPKGIPNPLLPENRDETANAVRESGADLGIAWDGDFDRCFFFDDTGGFVDGEYVVGLLASAFLSETPGDIIVHDPRVIWNTLDQIAKHDGQAAISKTGHAYIKHAMRETGAVYGGEMSAHHYFRDFMCCDSGMIPWLKVIELMGRTERSLASLVGRMKKDFPSSGEINFSLDNPNKCLQRVHMAFEQAATDIDTLDGLSMTFDNWRFNLRASSTEPLVRLNVEANRETVDLPKLVEILQNEILK